ncbi:MAG: mechanosensitive ion channel [Alphaproteobacteria bacterium]|nr:mechanosensitive ion channel [Alphaproteobacteria bacterium]
MDKQTRDWMQQLIDFGLVAGMDLLGALAILVAGFIVAGWAKGATRRALDRSGKLDETVKPFIANTVRYAILIFVLVAVLAQFGVQTASLIAALGTIGLAIGLALQGTLSNVAAGLMLLFLRPFRAGEYIDADGLGGTVAEIGLFATQMRTADGVFMHVPNSMLLNRSIKNYSRNPTRRVDVLVGVSYGDDIDKALEIASATLAEESRLLPEPAPQTMVMALADSSVNVNLRAWVNASDYWPVLFDMNRRIKLRIEEAGLTIPFPQRDVHVIERKAE